MPDFLLSIAAALVKGNIKEVVQDISLTEIETELSQSKFDRRQEEMAKMNVVVNFLDSDEKLKQFLDVMNQGITFPNFKNH